MQRLIMFLIVAVASLSLAACASTPEMAQETETPVENGESNVENPPEDGIPAEVKAGFYQGAVMGISGLVCDDPDMWKMVYEAGVEGGFTASEETYLAFQSVPNPLGDPMCGTVSEEMQFIKQVAVYEGMWTKMGGVIHQRTHYIVEVQLISDGYIYYLLAPIPLLGGEAT